jgi:hypothetical protein
MDPGVTGEEKQKSDRIVGRFLLSRRIPRS